MDRISGRPTRHLRAALVGRGIGASRTPPMHNAEGRRLDLRYEYGRLDFDVLRLDDGDLPQVIEQARRDGLAGLNVTHPFKESVLALLDRVTGDAEAIGAVNTIVFDDGAAIGHNTDCWGFAESFRRNLPGASPRSVVILGAGGAGKAVAKALIDLGTSRLTVVDIQPEKAERLVEDLSRRAPGVRTATGADTVAAISGADGLVNATPTGMEKYPGMPVDAGVLRPGLWVADLVYFPPETELLRRAAAAECRVLPGAGMAIFQAVRSFGLITGVPASPDEMHRHFVSARE